MSNKTNFPRLMRIHNLNKNNKLQQKMNNGHLAKTKPTNPISNRAKNSWPKGEFLL